MATHYYDITVDWKEGRIGTMSSLALPGEMSVATPPEFPEGVPGIWSPEHLFVASINSCLMTTFLAIAANSRLQFSGFRSKGTGKLEQVEGKFAISEVTLEPAVTVGSESEVEKALRILQKAEAACLISNSVKSKMIFKPEVKVSAD